MFLDEIVQKITIQANTKAYDVIDKKNKVLIQSNSMLGNSFRRAFGYLAGAFAVKDIVNTSVAYDSLVKSFNALAGSTENGARQIEFLREEAQRLGQDFLPISNAYKNLFASALGVGYGEEKTRSLFSGIMEASTVLGASSQKTELALLAVEQMLSKGKVSMEELRRQLSEALPGAFSIGAKAMGVTTQELNKLLEKGLDSQEFLTKFSVQLRKEFSGKKLVEPVKSLRAELARLRNAFFFLKVNIFDGLAGKELAKAVRNITELLSSKAMLASVKILGQALAFVFENLKLITGAVILANIKKLAAFSTLVALPWLAIAAAISAAVLAVSDLIDSLIGKDTYLMRFLKWAGGITPEQEKAMSSKSASTPSEFWNNVLETPDNNVNLSMMQTPIPQGTSFNPTINITNAQNLDENLLSQRIGQELQGQFTRFNMKQGFTPIR